MSHAIEAQIAALALRRSHLPDVPFRGASWAILLDVAAADRRGRPLRWSAAAVAGEIAPTTGGRHLHALIRAGVIDRSMERDGRVALVRLTDAGWAGLIGWLDCVAKASGTVRLGPAHAEQHRRRATIAAAAAQLRLVNRQLAGVV